SRSFQEVERYAGTSGGRRRFETCRAPARGRGTRWRPRGTHRWRRVRGLAAAYGAARRNGSRRAYSALGGGEAADVGWLGLSAHDLVWHRVVPRTRGRRVELARGGRCGALSGQAGGAQSG